MDGCCWTRRCGRLIWGAMFGAGLSCAPARADSGVTVSAILDAALEIGRFDRGVQLNRIQSGDLQATRLNLRGREELGGGMAAEFFLEMGPSLDTGAGGPVLWNRGSSVGLVGPLGRVDAGRQYMPLFWVTMRSEASTYTFSNMSVLLNTEHAAVTGHSGAAGFYDNVLRYRSPVLRGVELELAYSAGAELSGARRRDGVASGANVQYQGGPWWLGAAVHRYTAHGADMVVDQVQRGALVGAKYSAAAFTLGANYMVNRNMLGGANPGDARAAQLTLRLPLSGYDLNFGVGRLVGDKGRRTTTLHAGYVYFLSRRTQLYAYRSELRNNALGNSGLANLNADERVVTPGFQPSAVALGVRHAF